MLFNIIFIDEEKVAHRSFKRNFLDKNKEKFTGSYTVPLPNLDDMILAIFEKNPDAILTDFSLNDKKGDLPTPYSIGYNGGDLAEEVRRRRKNFPVFIATSLGDDAARDGYDVKLIHEKYGSFTDGTTSSSNSSADIQHLTFADKVFYEITSYKQFLDQCSNEFDQLIYKRSSESLSLKEEERLIELDGILEASIDQKSKLPEDLKIPSNIARLEKLVSLAEQILADKSRS